MAALKWTKEEAFLIASKFDDRTSLRLYGDGAYFWLHKKGYLDDACLHMSKKKMTREVAFKIALNYTTRSALRKDRDDVYGWLRFRSLLDEACKHMVSGLDGNNKDTRFKGTYNKSGIYILFNGLEVVYIGKSKDMAARLGRHVREGDKVFNKVQAFVINNKADVSIIEIYLINKHKPIYNKESNDYTDIPTICIDNINNVIESEFTFNINKKDT